MEDPHRSTACKGFSTLATAPASGNASGSGDWPGLGTTSPPPLWIVTSNTANGGINGIALIGSNNEVHANTTDNNIGLNGIWAPLGSTGNNITGNTSFNNAPFDMDDDNPNCDSNKWEGNRFNTTNQPSCVH